MLQASARAGNAPQAACEPDAVDVTAIVVNYNTADLLEPSIGALRRGAGALTLQVAIVDNASRDESVKLIRDRFADCDFIANDRNVGFGRANNQMLASATGRYILLLNTDAFVEADTLTRTVAFMDAHPDCGVLGVRLIGRDGCLQPSCRYFPTPWNSFLLRTGLNRWFPATRMVDDMGWDHASVRECDWVPGCYYLIRREVINKVGLFDPRFFLYFEEVDHCRAVKAAGWKVMFYPHTSVVHIGGESAKSDATLTSSGRQISELQIESEYLYFRKHHGRIGLCVHVGLSLLGDLIVGLKLSVRQGASFAGAAFLRDWRIRTRLLRSTRYGQTATR